MWTPTEEEKYGVVICSFRGSVPQGLILEIGETVQILEKCEEAPTLDDYNLLFPSRLLLFIDQISKRNFKLLP